MPNLTDLDREQRRVYGSAPNDGSLLVVGAPGTGKTVMAIHRAHKLVELGQRPTVIMYNNVLMRFTSSGDTIATDVTVTTMHKWTTSWWKRAFRTRTSPPHIAGSRWDFDWEEILRRVLASSRDDDGFRERANWGHLIIDEGQDFEETMYQALGLILGLDIWEGSTGPALTVFADDNQMLQEQRNSSTGEIAFRLGLSQDSGRRFLLKKNYRNTKEVASLAHYFQVNHPTGASDLPSRSGQVPSTIFVNRVSELASYIVRKLASSPGKQIGVIIPGSKRHVKSMFRRLKEAAAEQDCIVQGFLSGDENLNANTLDFEATDSITVLHYRSAKGLEFDVVFFVKLENLNIDPDGGTSERMVFYVMSSRAREELFLAFTGVDSGDEVPSAMALLPPPSKNLVKYRVMRGQDDQKTLVRQLLSNCQWMEPEVDDH
jgi:DNA helicase II / ATP-dependent DNA helicase PcrA